MCARQSKREAVLEHAEKGEDERITRLMEMLPGYDCGACGHGGCGAYARALVKDGAEMTLCKPGKEEIAGMIRKEMLENGE